MKYLGKAALKRFTPMSAKMKLEKWANANAMELALRRIRDRGYLPSAVIDVGAYHGEWTQLAKRVWPDAPVLMMEAQEEKMDILRGVADRLRDVRAVNALLGETDGEKRRFFTMETGSSMYEERTSAPRCESVKTVATLDRVLSNGEGLGKEVLLKLDVQGAEMEVLRGASAVLERCEFLLLECSVVEYNEGAPLLGEVLSIMGAWNFRIYDIGGVMRLPCGALGQLDVVFCKEGSSYRPSGVLW